MSTASTEILKQFYAAINRNDIDAAVTFLDPEILRIEPASHPTAGMHRGIEALRSHLKAGRGTWAEGTCEPERFEVFGEKILAHLHVLVRQNGKTEWIDARFPDGFIVRNGKIVEFHSFFEPEKSLEWVGVKK